MVLAACVLIVGITSSVALAAAGARPTQESVALLAPAPTATPVSAETFFDQVIVVAADGRTTAYANVSGSAIPAPEPGGAVIVLGANGAISIITTEGVLWYDAGGNPWGY